MMMGSARFGVFVFHRRAGKTVAAIMELIDRALNAPKRDNGWRGGYVAPFLKQAKEIAWAYLKQYTRPIPFASINESELTITFEHNGARIRLYGADNPDALRGGYFDFVVADEMKDWKPEVWDDIIRPMLADNGGGAMIIGTPGGMNKFYELYQYAQSGEDASWCAALYRVDETDALKPEEIADMKRTMAPMSWRREMLCDFTASADDTLITIDVVAQACARHCRVEQYEHAPLVFGVDVARFGGDKSVVFARQGVYVHKPLVWQGIDNMALASRVAQLIDAMNPDAVFIDAGGGAGVIDRLRQMGKSVIEVHFGGSATSGQFFNRRTEMWAQMARGIRDGLVLPPMTELKADLTAPTYRVGDNGVMRLEPKEDIKKRLGRSPDYADALALTYAEPVTSRKMRGIIATHQSKPAVADWNPFDA